MRMLASLVVAHAGVLVMVAVAAGLWSRWRENAPTFEREPLPPLGAVFVYVFALVPIAIAVVIAVLFGQDAPVGGIAPLVVLSTLAVVVAAGDTIALHHARVLGLLWLALLLGPSAIVATTTIVGPLAIAADLDTDRPAKAMGQFFTDSFNRRTGKPLAIVAGEARLAALIAMSSPDRPRVFFPATPARSPWVGVQDVATKGAVVVWPATDTAGTPPPYVKAMFPDLVVEVPRAFERPLQGRLPLLRIGWATIRPRGDATPTPAPLPSPR
jgi:hypothetical protein